MKPQRSDGNSQPAHRPLGPIFYRYVAREAMRPALFALIGLTVVILTKDLLGYSDLIINRGLSARTVGAMAFFQGVPITALMFPFSVLLGCLVAMGRLGADREILTLEASGVPAGRLVLPLILFAIAMFTVSLYATMVASPWAYRSLDRLLDRVKSEKPWSQMHQGEAAEFAGWRVEAREVSSSGKRLEGVLMWVPSVGETIFARSGRMTTEADGSVNIHLRNGSVIPSARDNARAIRFDVITTKLPDNEGEADESRNQPRRRGMTLAELSERMTNRKAATEYHRRFALPTASLVFGLLAGPLILLRKKYSRSSGSVLGIAMTLSYYALTQLGEGMIQREQVGIAAGVWLPNVLLTLVAVVLLVRVVRSSALGSAFERPVKRARKAPERVVAKGYRPHRYPLPRYITGRFVQMLLLAFSVMMVAYLLIDVMERLDWFAKHGAAGDEILRYYAARLPLLASRVVPMAMLVATALTVSVLTAEGELVGMRSCGIPAPRALLPVFFVSALMVPVFFALNDFVVPRTNAIAKEVKDNEIKDDLLQKEPDLREETAWYRAGDQVIAAERFDPEKGEASELVIYQIGDDELPVSRIDAKSARHIGQGIWRLRDPQMTEVTRETVHKVPPPRYADLGKVLAAEVSTSQLSVAALNAEIAEMQADGYDTTTHEVDRHVKLAQPLACFILPALALFFAVGGPPFPGPAQNLLVSIVAGVGYLLSSGVSASLGYGGTLTPVVGGWGPNILFALIAAYFGLRIWRPT